METDFSKDFFKKAWGDEGYYEEFSYGVGIEKVCSISLYPFFNPDSNALEIGCGGGVFTERMVNKFNHLTAIDVIAEPKRFKLFESFTYIEQGDHGTDCSGVPDNTIDFCFSYNLFCHLSNTLLIEYLTSVFRVLKSGGEFIFMISNYRHSKQFVPEGDEYNLGEMLPSGHFYQDGRTLDIIINVDQWEVLSRNMIPEHRDIIIHLKKK